MRPDRTTASGPCPAPLPGDGAIAASTLVGRIGTELGTLARLAATLQDGLSDCLPALLAGSGRSMVQVQSIDRMTQMLEDLTRVMSSVADTLPGDLHLPAGTVLDVIRMTELSHALGSPASGERPDRTMSDGEVAWF